MQIFRKKTKFLELMKLNYIFIFSYKEKHSINIITFSVNESSTQNFIYGGRTSVNIFYIQNIH